MTRNEESKFKLATETRNAIQEAALLIQSAQSLLPTVQFPYCTQREISALLQVSINILSIIRNYNIQTSVVLRTNAFSDSFMFIIFTLRYFLYTVFMVQKNLNIRWLEYKLENTLEVWKNFFVQRLKIRTIKKYYII